MHNLVSHADLYQVLDKWVQTRSYICGMAPSQADVVTFEAINTAPAVQQYPNAYRWYCHIRTYQADFPLLPGDKSRPYTAYGPDEEALLQESNEPNDEDLFGSDEEAESPEIVAEREERLAEYRRRNESRVKPAAKSIITLDIKPHGDDTDMDALKAAIVEIEMDGLVWGSSKFIPVGYGIRKLQIHIVVEDEKVSMDELEEKVVDGLSDFVQSMDTVAMQKL